MNDKRIIAHYMHEEELSEALDRMSSTEVTDSYVIGLVSESDIEALREKGLIVQVLDDEDPETPGVAGGGVPGVARSPARRPMTRGMGSPGLDLTKPQVYLVRLAGPLLEPWRDTLHQQEIRFLEHIPRNAYTAKLSAEQARSCAALDFVSSIRPYDVQDTGPIAPSFAGTRGGPGPGSEAVGTRMITYDVRLHSGEELRETLDWLEEHGVSVAGARRGKIRLYLLEDSPLVAEIAALAQVARVEEYVVPRLLNDVARRLLGIDAPASGTGAQLIAQTGSGQIVGVADTGLDADHQDFQGRITGIVALGRPGDPSDPNGHGTHVAGSVLGDGSASGGQVRGTAPEATLFFQSLLDSTGGLGGLPLHLFDLFDEAYQNGARVHNNSWGAATSSMYTINSIEVDEFVAERRDMLVVIAAGNEGTAASNLNANPGFVDWLSIGSPASCKNALTVGASRTERSGVGWADFSYSDVWPSDYPDAPIANAKVSGDPEEMAGFSSRGPCDDRRIKPDVVAPGTDIASVKSSRAPLRSFWGPFPGNSGYAFMGGTSMAAPLVSGCAALVREYFLSARNHEPSAALVKSVLVNSTRWLSGDGAVAGHAATPNYNQGFGCVYMPWAIPNEAEPALTLEFVDEWEPGGQKFGATGQRHQFHLTVSGGEWLRLCLSWTDLAARALQNNLNLFLQEVATGRKWIGNAGSPGSLNIPDPDNNVEIIRLENPASGDYIIQVQASNLLQAGQDYALVATGEFTGGLVRT